MAVASFWPGDQWGMRKGISQTWRDVCTWAFYKVVVYLGDEGILRSGCLILHVPVKAIQKNTTENTWVSFWKYGNQNQQKNKVLISMSSAGLAFCSLRVGTRGACRNLAYLPLGWPLTNWGGNGRRQGRKQGLQRGLSADGVQRCRETGRKLSLHSVHH